MNIDRKMYLIAQFLEEKHFEFVNKHFYFKTTWLVVNQSMQLHRSLLCISSLGV